MSITAQFDYIAPTTLTDAARQLTGEVTGRLIAGGHTLLGQLKRQEIRPKLLVDLRAIPELRQISWPATNRCWLGAMVTFAAILNDDSVLQAYPILSPAIKDLSDPQVRNRCTIGGMLATYDTRSPLLPALLAYGCDVHIWRNGVETIVPIDQFIVGENKTVLQSGDIITGVTLPEVTDDTYAAYQRVVRPNLRELLGGVAIVAHCDADLVIDKCRVALSGVNPFPKRLDAIEAMLVGQRASASTASDVEKQIAATQYRDIASADMSAYGQHMATILLSRAISTIELNGNTKN